MGEVKPYGASASGRSPDRIEADIDARRRRLAETLDEIAVRTHPSTIKAEAQAKASEALDRTVGRVYAKANGALARAGEVVRKELFDGYGSPRLDRVVPAAAVVVAVVGIAVWRRRK